MGARLMGLIGDGYFERYGKDTDSKVREEEERRVEKKLEEIPEEEVPTVVDEVLEKSPSDAQEEDSTIDQEPTPNQSSGDSLGLQ